MRCLSRSSATISMVFGPSCNVTSAVKGRCGGREFDEQGLAVDGKGRGVGVIFYMPCHRDGETVGQQSIRRLIQDNTWRRRITSGLLEQGLAYFIQVELGFRGFHLIKGRGEFAQGVLIAAETIIDNAEFPVRKVVVNEVQAIGVGAVLVLLTQSGR